MPSVLDAPYFHDEAAAYEKLEGIIWPNGPVCPHCGEGEHVSRMQGKATRIGLLKCYACRKQFRVTVGTIFEGSHIPLHTWLQAVYLMVSSKKGVSSNQLHRTMGITLKSAWFMSHRIREAMRETHGKGTPKLGGPGGIIEADETYIGGKAANRAYGSIPPKQAVASLVERGEGSQLPRPERDCQQPLSDRCPPYPRGQPVYDRRHQRLLRDRPDL